MTLSFFKPLATWRPSAAALGAAALLGAAGLATVSALADDVPMEHGAMQNRGGEHGPQRAMEWFKTRLKLTSSQAALWDRAVSTMHPPADARERARQSHEQYLAALMDPSFDPRKWLAQEDQTRAEREAHMKESRNAWLAVWDSLDAAQRTQVREFLFKRAEHRGHGGWAHHEGHAWGNEGAERGYGDHDGPGGPAPAAPAKQ